jgi:hypothetical protein
MNLLSVSADAKTVKGEKKGYLTGILYLLPADSSGITNLCTNASPGCKAACLNTAGRGVFSSVQAGRMRKTKLLVENREEFLRQLHIDILSVIKKAKTNKMTPCFRLNGTSDLPWLGRYFAKKYPNVQFYDYTKHPKPWERTLPNYHLTFSYSETNAVDCMYALEHNINVAMVFDTKRGQPLPKTWCGFKVYDGDVTDLRFKNATKGFNQSGMSTARMQLMKKGGIIIGLRAKGKAKKDCTGFVVKAGAAASQLVQIAKAPCCQGWGTHDITCVKYGQPKGEK